MKGKTRASNNKALLRIASLFVTLTMVLSLVPTRAVAEMREELAELDETHMVAQEDHQESQESVLDNDASEPSQEQSEESSSAAEDKQANDQAETQPTAAEEVEEAKTQSAENVDAESTASEHENDSTEEGAAVAEERNAQQTLTYEDDAVKVTAKLDDAAALPKDARLVVTPVTEGDSEYPYDAYMNALNHSMGEAQIHNSQNTMLYDVAFFAPNENGDDVEVQPSEGAVHVSFDFKQNQLKDELDAKKSADVDVVHMPVENGEPVVEPLDAKVSVANETASFSTTSFSVYAFSYTVDFAYDGFTYSIAGQSDILLSKLFQILSIDENVAHVANVTFSNDELVKVERSGEDWLLTSLKPFTSEELLTVTMASGAEYRIVVTDAQGEAVSITLNSFDNTGATSAAFAPTDDGGHYWVFAQLTSKETGDVVGWAAQQIDSFVGRKTQSITLNSFTPVEGEGTLAYNASEHNIAVRFMWNKTNADVTYDYFKAQQKTDGDARALFDIIGGYTFQTSDDPNPTVSDANPATINLRHDLNENEYALHLTFNDVSGKVSKGRNSRYYVIGKIKHQSEYVYFYAPITEPSDGASQYFVINGTQGGKPYTWLDQNGGYKNERFTGKEAATQLYVVEWTGSGEMQFNGQIIQRINGQGGSSDLNILSSKDATGDYSFSFATERGKRTDGNKTQYYDTVEFNKVNGGLTRDEVLSTLAHALEFGLYTGDLKGHVSDMEANIAAGTVTAGNINSDYGFSDNNKQVNKLTVTKTYVDKGGKPLASEPVEILLYMQSGSEWVRVGNSKTGTTNASGKLVVEFDKLGAGVYQVREKVNGTELSIGNTTVGEGANKVVASFGDNITFVGSALNINYFVDINDNASTSDLVKLLSKSRNGIVIAGNEADYNRLLAARKTMSGFTGSVYLAGNDIPGVGTYAALDIASDLEAYRALCVALAQTSDTETINVYNYTYNTLPNDMYKLNSDGKLVVVNIDMTGVAGSANVLTKTNLDGENLEAHFNKDGSSAKRRIIYNLYVRNADGSIAPYTGSVNTNGTTSGTLLAPGAQLGSLAGDWGGTMISASTYHSGGEIHSEYDNVERTQKTSITNTKGGEQQEEKGSLTIKKNVTVNDKATASTLADGTYSFAIAGPNGYTNNVTLAINNGQSAQTTLNDLVPGEYTVTEMPPTNGTSLVGDNNITCKVVANNTANIPTAEFTNNKTYSYHTKGQITLSGTKELQGRALREGEFTFELYEAGAKTPIRTATNKADGSYAFDKIEYTEADLDTDASGNFVPTTKTYRVVEKAGDDASVDYDQRAYDVTVTLTDDGLGRIEAKANRGVNNLDFTNTYTAGGYVQLEGTKTMEGRNLKSTDSFVFTVEPQNGAPFDLRTIGTDEVPSTKITDGKAPVVASTGNTWTYGFRLYYTLENLKNDDGTYADHRDFVYTVSESGTEGGVTNDKDSHRTIVVRVTDPRDGSGRLYANTIEGTENIDFTNAYEAKGNITLSGTKELQGRALREGEFTFELRDAEGNLLQEAKNEADGSYSFKTINYTLNDLDTDASGAYVPTTKTYRVVEKAGDDASVAYDQRAYNVTVTLTDDGQGHIEAKANRGVSNLDFTNTYRTTGGITLSGTKELQGRALREGEFTFELRDAEGNPLQETTNKADGSYAFEKLQYTGADLDTDASGAYVPTTKAYRVVERAGDDTSVDYDQRTYDVTVTLTDDDQGHIDAVATPDNGTYQFTNTYRTAGEITLSGTKELQGRKLREGEFTFELYEGSAKTPIRTATNAADGSYAFDKIEYTEADLDTDARGAYVPTTKTYRVVEKAGTDTSIHYDQKAYDITVTLTDDGQGHIEARANRGVSNLDFTNAYEAKGEITFSGTKTMEGMALTKGAFTFQLKDAEGNLLQEAKNEADGSYSFKTINYTLNDLDTDAAGNHVPTTKTYTVSEAKGNNANIDYDTTVYTIVVTLKDKGNNVIEVTSDKVPGACNFTNTYRTTGGITLSGTKELQGRALREGEFTFELYEGNAKDPMSTATNKADGSYAFDKIEYTGADLDTDASGAYVPTTKTYRVVEKAGDDASVDYDQRTYNVTVTLTDDGQGHIDAVATPDNGTYQFTNTYHTSGEVELSGTKTLEGAELEEGQFAFELYEAGAKTPIRTATNKADGSYAFGELRYTEADLDTDANGNFVPTEKTYRVVEKAGDDQSVAYDKKTYSITVTLTDNGEGHIDVDSDDGLEQLSKLDFVNKKLGTLRITKTVDGVSVSEQAGKEFTVSILYTGEDEEYLGHFLTADGSFVEEYDAQHPRPTVPAGGELVIPNIPTGTYQVTEVLDEDAHAEDRAYVNLFGDGYLFLEASGDGEADVPANGVATIDLVNVYSTNGKGSLRVVKVVNSTIGLTDEEKKAIEFVVKDEDGNVIGQKSLYDFQETYGGSQAWVLTDLEPGRYTVAEIRHDPTSGEAVEQIGAVSYEVEAGSGEFDYGLTEGTVVVNPDEASTVTVQNTFDEVVAYTKLKVQKLVEGTTQSERYTPDEQFVFDIAKVNDPAVDGVPSSVLPTDPTITVVAGGTGESDNIYYTQDGTYYYTITEREPEHKTPGMTYDTKPRYAKVVVDKNGAATVTYGTKLVKNEDGTYELAGVQEGDQADHATVTNTYEVGGLTVTKTVAGNLTVDDLTQEEREATVFTVTGPNDYRTSFTLADMGPELQKTLLGLPLGTYTVNERSAARDGWVINTTYSAEDGKVAVAADESTPAEVAVTNTYTEEKTVSLEVRKVVQSDDAADKDKEFAFQVTLSEPLTGAYGDMDFVDGVATFMLKDGESAIAAGLPEDVTHQVEEVDSGDLLSSATEDQTDAGAVITYTNTRGGTTKTGNLEVTKAVRSAQTSDKQTAFGFKVTLSDETINGTYGAMEFEHGVATFTLKDGESVRATGLPVGTKYDVVETNKGGLLSKLTASADGSTVTCANTRVTNTPNKSTTTNTTNRSSNGGTPVGSRTSTPKTADSTSTAMVVGLAVLGALGIVASSLRRRKQ